MYSKYDFGFTTVLSLLLNLYLNDCSKGSVLVICILHFALFFAKSVCKFIFTNSLLITVR